MFRRALLISMSLAVLALAGAAPRSGRRGGMALAQGQLCSQCDPSPLGNSSCNQPCTDCSVDYPDGQTCGPGQGTGSTCGQIWGCCPQWVRGDRVLVGMGQHNFVAICEAHNTYEVTYVDVNGCFGDWKVCEEDTIHVAPGYAECGDWGWGRRSC
jgi:hypothetical protein